MTENQTTPPEPTSAEIAAAAEEDKKGRGLSATAWAEIESHWAFDTMTTREICQKWGISPSAITQHFAKLRDEGRPIPRGSRKSELTEVAAAKIVENKAASTAGPVAAEAQKAETFESKRRRRIEQARNSLYNASIANHIQFNKIQKLLNDASITPAQAAADIKALRQMELLIRDNRQNLFSVLDVKSDIDEAALPQLTFRDLSDEEIAKMQEGEDEDDLDLSLPEVKDDIVEDDAVGK